MSVCAATRGVLSFACRRCDMLASGRRRALAHARTEVRTAQVQEAGRVALCGTAWPCYVWPCRLTGACSVGGRIGVTVRFPSRKPVPGSRSMGGLRSRWNENGMFLHHSEHELSVRVN